MVSFSGACSLLTDLSGFSGGPVDAGPPIAMEAGSDAEAGAPLDAGVDAPPDAGSAYAAAVLADGPIAYLRLGDPMGGTAADATGHGNSGTLGTGHTFGVPGALANDPNTAL